MFNHRFKEINKIEDADSLKRREQREKDIKIHKLEKEIEVNNYAISDLNSQIEKLQKQLLKLQEEKDRFIEELNALKN